MFDEYYGDLIDWYLYSYIDEDQYDRIVYGLTNMQRCDDLFGVEIRKYYEEFIQIFGDSKMFMNEYINNTDSVLKRRIYYFCKKINNEKEVLDIINGEQNYNYASNTIVSSLVDLYYKYCSQDTDTDTNIRTRFNYNNEHKLISSTKHSYPFTVESFINYYKHIENDFENNILYYCIKQKQWLESDIIWMKSLSQFIYNKNLNGDTNVCDQELGINLDGVFDQFNLVELARVLKKYSDELENDYKRISFYKQHKYIGTYIYKIGIQETNLNINSDKMFRILRPNQTNYIPMNGRL